MAPPTRSLVAGVAVALVALLVGCTSQEGAAPDASPTTTDPAPATTTTVAPPVIDGPTCADVANGESPDSGPYAVGRIALDYVDLSRRTEPAPETRREASAGRRLPTVVLYPAVGQPAEPGSLTDGAEPTNGAFPVVVFAHGVSSTGAENNEMLARWAHAGYIVLVPTFPLTRAGVIDVTDLPNQPEDVVFVARTFASDVQSPDHPLNGRARTNCLVVAGHSLGAATAVAAAFDPCCGAISPVGVIDLSGPRFGDDPEGDGDDDVALPALIVHGEEDQTVPYAQSELTFEQLPGPTWFLTFLEGGHVSMFEPPEVELMTEAVVAFLDAQAKGLPAALAQLGPQVRADPSATLQIATAPPGG